MQAQAQPPHPVSEEGKRFLASLSPRELELQTMMSKSLGSSYFVERTHAFRKWKQRNPHPHSAP
jgi:hypothetical protein